MPFLDGSRKPVVIVAAAVVAVAVACSALPLIACQQGNVTRRPGEPDIVSVGAEDAAMNAAIAEARRTLSSLEADVRAGRLAGTPFAIKVRMTEDKKVEHLWLAEAAFDGDTIRGTVNNEPIDVRSVKLGQRIAVPRSDVTDWMYVADGKLHGGYTVRVALDKLPPAERAETMKGMGITP